MNTGSAYILLCYKPFFKRRQNMQICISAVNVTTGLQRHCRRLRCCVGDFVVSMKIPYSPAIRHKIAVEAPFTQFSHQLFRRTRRLAVHPVICTHNTFDPALFYKRFKCRQIGFFQILLAYPCVKLVAKRLGTAVYSKMLCAGGGSEVFFFSLYALYEVHAEP